VIDVRVADVAALWATQRSAPFPSRLRGAEIAGVDIVMLDAQVAGCVSSWLSNGGSLDRRRRDALAACRDHLDRVIPELAGAEAIYCRRLRDLGVLVLDDSRDS
jgi:hypothetical protein